MFASLNTKLGTGRLIMRGGSNSGRHDYSLTLIRDERHRHPSPEMHPEEQEQPVAPSRCWPHAGGTPNRPGP